MEDNATDTVTLAADLTAAWLGNTSTRVLADEVPAFLKSMHETLRGLATASTPTGDESPAAAVPEYAGAVSARKSLADPAHIISMIDGKPYKSLRRHLSAQGLTPEDYRARYNLKSDYPMVAPEYSEARRAVAKRLGLGRKPGQSAEAPTATEAAPALAKTRGRPKGVAAAKKAAQAHLGGTTS